MHTHTAWLTTDPTCLTGTTPDVAVTTETTDGHHHPIWLTDAPTGDPADATALLHDAGWTLTGPWEAIPTGACAPVTRTGK